MLTQTPCHDDLFVLMQVGVHLPLWWAHTLRRRQLRDTEQRATTFHDHRRVGGQRTIGTYLISVEADMNIVTRVEMTLVC
jgi:hypothetical protein